MKTKARPWRNRITRTGTEAPDQLLANPRNWRIHPKNQTTALDGVLSEVGWVTHVIVNERTGHVIDGHARIGLAITRQETEVPVVYVDLDEAEEALILATLDPLGALAGADKDVLAELMTWVSTEDEAVTRLLADVAMTTGITTADDYTKPATATLTDAEVDRRLWPRIVLQVAPDVITRWNEVFPTVDGADDSARIDTVISLVLRDRHAE